MVTRFDRSRGLRFAAVDIGVWLPDKKPKWWKPLSTLLAILGLFTCAFKGSAAIAPSTEPPAALVSHICSTSGSQAGLLTSGVESCEPDRLSGCRHLGPKTGDEALTAGIDTFTAPATLTTASAHRRELSAYPSSIVNGSVSATFPADAFAAWCLTNPTCAAAGNLGLSLAHYTDSSPFTSATSSWPNVFTGPGISDLQLVSGVVDLQLTGIAAKQDPDICDSASPCAAQLTFALTAAADASLSFVCLRLEPTATGASSFQAYGFPDGSSGMSVQGPVTANTARCSTTRFGKHVVLQYRQSSQVQPSPSSSLHQVRSPQPPSTRSSSSSSPLSQASSSSALPPPPLQLNAGGPKYASDVHLQMLLGIALGFDRLKSNASLLEALTTSLETSLTSSLGTGVAALLGMSSAPVTGSIRKISRAAGNTQVSVDFRLVVPAGSTSGQVASLMSLATGDTPSLFVGSQYTSSFVGPATVSIVSSPSEEASLSVAAVVGLAVGVAVMTLLAIGIGYALYRWHSFAAIAPKKPKDGWDPTGVAVTPRKGARRRRGAAIRPYDQQEGPTAQEGWPPGPSGAGQGGSAATAPWDAGGGGSSPDGGGALAGVNGVKTGAALPPSREAWM